MSASFLTGFLKHLEMRLSLKFSASRELMHHDLQSALPMRDQCGVRFLTNETTLCKSLFPAELRDTCAVRGLENKVRFYQITFIRTN